MSYFVGILSGVVDIFLSSCPQVFSLLNLRFRGISELHKSLVQRGESSSILLFSELPPFGLDFFVIQKYP